MKQKTKQGAGKKTPPPLNNHRKSTIERDPRVFHRTANWAQWWEEFYLTLDASGKYLYTSVAKFVKAKTEDNKTAATFMKWYLGPPPIDPEAESPFPWCSGGPVDWYTKRKDGGWFSDNNLKKFGVEIRRRLNALEALREAGNGITLHSLVRAEQLAQELDRSFHGRMFLDSLDFGDNMARAQAYVGLHGQILNMKAQAQDLYARSHGVNFDDLSSLAQLMSAAALSGTATGGTTRENAALKAVVDMALQKNARYNLELPPGSVEVIADAATGSEQKKKLH